MKIYTVKKYYFLNSRFTRFVLIYNKIKNIACTDTEHALYTPEACLGFCLGADIHPDTADFGPLTASKIFLNDNGLSCPVNTKHVSEIFVF